MIANHPVDLAVGLVIIELGDRVINQFCYAGDDAGSAFGAFVKMHSEMFGVNGLPFNFRMVETGKLGIA